MPCFHPIEAFQHEAGGSLFFVERRNSRKLRIPCGQCIGCRLERSRQWAVRCVCEARLHKANCFVTLTYRDNPRSLRYSDFQLFMKRFRKEFGPTRFMMCGEYGGRLGRPHFHAIFFGRDFPDRVVAGGSPDMPLWSSAALDRVWSHGACRIGNFTFDTAAYVARYCLKKVTGRKAAVHYEFVDPSTGEVTSLVPEFGNMSRRPGIGSDWIRKYFSDVYPHGLVVVRGREVFPPRFFDKIFSELEPGLASELKAQRALASDIWEQTPERLAVRETVAAARVAFKKRSL